VTDPDGLAALKAVWDAFLSNIQLEQAENAFSQLLTFAASCKDRLVEAGFPEPPETLPANAFQTEASYECDPTFLK